MNELTTLERRGMAAISTPGGSMLIVAADQRNGMKAVMTDAPDGPASVTTEQLAAAKSDLVTVPRQPRAGDPARPRGRPARGRRRRDARRGTRRSSSAWTPPASRPSTGCGTRTSSPGVDARGPSASSAATSRRCCGTCAPTSRTPESRVAEEIRDLVKACEAEGLLLIVELLTYRLEGESEEDYRAAFPQLVADAASLAVDCGAKVLKLPYPGSAEACAAVTEAAKGVPWAVLSAGVDHETFIEQVADRDGQRRQRRDGRPIAVEGQPGGLARGAPGPADHAGAAAAARAGRGRRLSEPRQSVREAVSSRCSSRTRSRRSRPSAGPKRSRCTSSTTSCACVTSRSAASVRCSR